MLHRPFDIWFTPRDQIGGTARQSIAQKLIQDLHEKGADAQTHEFRDGVARDVTGVGYAGRPLLPLALQIAELMFSPAATDTVRRADGNCEPTLTVITANRHNFSLYPCDGDVSRHTTESTGRACDRRGSLPPAHDRRYRFFAVFAGGCV